MSARMRLRRADGVVYLDRWGWERKRIGGIFLHRMDGPDPGMDLHDHPWWFLSFVVKGGYRERRIQSRIAHWTAPEWRRIANVTRKRWSVRFFGLDQAHTILELPWGRTWTIVVHGPQRRAWGFYLPKTGYVWWQEYDRTVRAERRDLFADITSDGDPRAKGRS